MDLSYLALQEARATLGEKGVYILGDITNLPLADNCTDALISLHTIYHVPAEQQKQAFHEIHRVLAPGRTAVVVYSWGNHSTFMKLASFLARAISGPVRRFFKKLVSDPQAETTETLADPLYFHAYPYRWFVEQEWEFDIDILVWRSVNVRFLRAFIHERLFGRHLVALLGWLEDRFPRIAGRLGQYPLFVIRKDK